MTKKTPYDLTSVFLFFVFLYPYISLNIIRVSVDLLVTCRGLVKRHAGLTLEYRVYISRKH